MGHKKRPRLQEQSADAGDAKDSADAAKQQQQEEEKEEEEQQQQQQQQQEVEGGLRNEYAGFRPAEDGCPVRRVRLSACGDEKQWGAFAEGDVRAFFARHVATREPAVIESDVMAPGEAGAHAGAERKDLAQLFAALRSTQEMRARAGQATISVEVRGPSDAKVEKEKEVRLQTTATTADEQHGHIFGHGRESQMRFAEFLDGYDQGCREWYLTTQELQYDAEGRPTISSEPLTSMRGMFPWQPSLMGHLVPQNVNVWMGCASPSRPSSTGLHHDFHDNLYVLLQGRKRFRLFAPSDAAGLAVRGTMVRVHSNGRMNYAGCPTRADGADLAADAAALAAKRLREAVEQDEGDDAIDSALEAILAAETSSAWQTGEGEDDGDDGDSDDDESAREQEQEEEEEGQEEEEEEAAATTNAADEAAKPPPENFSRIDLTRPREDIVREFPAFAQCHMMECELRAGEMLFLPCGWFHEVTSYGEDEEHPQHCAFNFWFHPPDALDSFECPYSSPFWQSDFDERCEEGGPV